MARRSKLRRSIQQQIPKRRLTFFETRNKNAEIPTSNSTGQATKMFGIRRRKKAGTLSFPRRRVEERPGFMSDDTTHSWCTVGLEQVYRCTFPARFYTSLTSVAEVARGKIRPDLPSLCPVLSLTNQQIRRGLNTRPYCSKGFEKCVNIMKLFFLTLDPLGILHLTTN